MPTPSSVSPIRMGISINKASTYRRNSVHIEIGAFLPFLSLTNKSKIETRDEFYESFKSVLVMGRLINVLPITGVCWTSNSNGLQFSWRSLPALFSVVLLLTTILALCAETYEIIINTPSSVTNVAIAIMTVAYTSMGVFVYSYFLLRSKNIITFIQTWRPTCDKLCFGMADPKLRKHVIVIILAIWGWAMLENFLYDYACVLNGAGVVGADAPILEKLYFGGFARSLGHIIPFSQPSTILLLLYDKLRCYAWNYMDILIVTTSRALSFKFKSLHLYCDSLLKYWDKTDKQSFSENNFLMEVRREFLILCKLVDEADKILSPVIFVSYCVNIYCISVHLFRWVTTSEKSTHMEGVYTLVSFMQFFARSCMVTHFGGQIHSYAIQIVNSLQQCPDSKYTASIERLERMMILNPVGLTGLKVFFVKRQFLISIVNFIFTLEIVLLQTSAAVGTTS